MATTARKLRRADAPGPKPAARLTPAQVLSIRAANTRVETIQREATAALTLATTQLALAVAQVERDTGLRLTGKDFTVDEDGSVTFGPEPATVA